MSAFRLPDRPALAAWLGVAVLLVWGVAVPCGCSAGAGTTGAAADAESADEPDLPVADGFGSDTSESGPALELLGDAEAGRLLYQAVTRGCYVCHGDAAEGTALAPGIETATAAEIQGSLMSGTRHAGGPQVDLAAQDFADLAAFLAHPEPVTPDINTNGPDANTNGMS